MHENLLNHLLLVHLVVPCQSRDPLHHRDENLSAYLFNAHIRDPLFLENLADGLEQQVEVLFEELWLCFRDISKHLHRRVPHVLALLQQGVHSFQQVGVQVFEVLQFPRLDHLYMRPKGLHCCQFYIKILVLEAICKQRVKLVFERCKGFTSVGDQVL